MNEQSRNPSRLVDEPTGSPLMQALLRAGRDVQASQATRVKLYDALGLDGASASRGWMPRLPLRRGPMLLLAAVVASVAAAAVPLVTRSLSSLSAAVPAEGIVSPVPVATSDLAPLPKPHLDVPTGSVDSSESARGSEAVAAAPRTPARPSARNLLAAELAALDAVRKKLDTGEPKAALGLLDGYQRDFPKPRLALEAEVLRIDALDRAGQPELAKKRAAAFVQSHPKGVLTGRVRRYLEQ